MQPSLDLQSIRARKARFANKLGSSIDSILTIACALLVAVVIATYLIHQYRLAYVAIAILIILIMFLTWLRQDLKALSATGPRLEDRLSGAVLSRLNPKVQLSPRVVWSSLKSNWQFTFFTNHFLLSPDTIDNLLSDQPSDMTLIWDTVINIANSSGTQIIEPSVVASALLQTSPAFQNLLVSMKLSSSDLIEVSQWLERMLDGERSDKPYFGGIGRDWANGFTPLLNQFGHNISLYIESHGGHFSSLVTSPGVTAIKNAFAQGASGIALIGPTGIGKTSHVTALAQLLLAEKDDHNLEHRQIVELNASFIISSAQRPGQLENVVLRLMQETLHAGHIILFLDNAQLFFTNSAGAFDATQILLPIIQAKAIQIIFAMTPNDFQSLKAHNSAFATLLTPVVITEPDETSILHILEDNTLNMEHQHRVLIAYEAILEAIRLSGRYEQEEAYPGKAIRLLEHALSHANQQMITSTSVQDAIEQTHGVKVGAASSIEADTLLHLEDNIHQRMINQSRAVTVVSNALRRARAGVANPKRPIGSFLFLGPTGVGKTELAKSIAATYFNSESNMIRLDMSEYQQAEDISRLLSDGSSESMSLILAVRQQPFSVVLLDEIEKSHPNILNLLLQLLDEGQLTDTAGRVVSFKDCIIIATSNAGAQEIRERVERGEKLEAFEDIFINNLINSNQFKAELLNRFDEIVLFRPLDQNELLQVVALMVSEINDTLSKQNITVQLTQAAASQIVTRGYDARLGARPMRRMLQRTVEDVVAKQILANTAKAGDHIILDVSDLPLEDRTAIASQSPTT